MHCVTFPVAQPFAGFDLSRTFGDRQPISQLSPPCRRCACANGCNPDVDAFDDCWALARNELGGDDFGEHFDLHSEAFTRILNAEDDLELAATATHLMLRTVSP
ncbi:hypothetical protein C4K03_2392 [Pseudomonas synxantha]|uniref:Uncharacterized protein n=1 Tax=Pseudomonas synxantha TaxID=47883 RepID=A0A3G7U5E7_9PSED|nr:hypothetical protein C4K03_2392 [Pseudomonas synxantha]